MTDLLAPAARRPARPLVVPALALLGARRRDRARAARSSAPCASAPTTARPRASAPAGCCGSTPRGARDPEAGRRLVAALHPGARRGVSRWASGWPALHPRPALGRRPGAVRDRGAAPARPGRRGRGRRGLSRRRARAARARGRAHGGDCGWASGGEPPEVAPRLSADLGAHLVELLRPAAARRDGGLVDRASGRGPTSGRGTTDERAGLGRAARRRRAQPAIAPGARGAAGVDRRSGRPGPSFSAVGVPRGLGRPRRVAAGVAVRRGRRGRRAAGVGLAGRGLGRRPVRADAPRALGARRAVGPVGRGVRGPPGRGRPQPPAGGAAGRARARAAADRARRRAARARARRTCSPATSCSWGAPGRARAPSSSASPPTTCAAGAASRSSTPTATPSPACSTPCRRSRRPGSTCSSSPRRSARGASTRSSSTAPTPSSWRPSSWTRCATCTSPPSPRRPTASSSTCARPS